MRAAADGTDGTDGTDGFLAYKATNARGRTCGTGGGSLPLHGVVRLSHGKRLRVAEGDSVQAHKTGLQVCLFPAQCRVFYPEPGARVWRVWVPPSARTHAVDCWRVAVSELRVMDEVVSREDEALESCGRLFGPNGTFLSMWRGRLHSTDGVEPSEVAADGTQRWHRHGAVHRADNKPAVAFANGLGFWIRDGVWTRDGGKRVVGTVADAAPAAPRRAAARMA